MAVLEHLEPKGVFHYFEELCAIPHGSSNTKAVSDWLMAFAEEWELEAYQDDLNNVVIIKEATPGYEEAEPLILQALRLYPLKNTGFAVFGSGRIRSIEVDLSPRHWGNFGGMSRAGGRESKFPAEFNFDSFHGRESFPQRGIDE